MANRPAKTMKMTVMNSDELATHTITLLKNHIPGMKETGGRLSNESIANTLKAAVAAQLEGWNFPPKPTVYRDPYAAVVSLSDLKPAGALHYKPVSYTDHAGKTYVKITSDVGDLYPYIEDHPTDGYAFRVLLGCILTNEIKYVARAFDVGKRGEDGMPDLPFDQGRWLFPFLGQLLEKTGKVDDIKAKLGNLIKEAKELKYADVAKALIGMLRIIIDEVPLVLWTVVNTLQNDFVLACAIFAKFVYYFEHSDATATEAALMPYVLAHCDPNGPEPTNPTTKKADNMMNTFFINDASD
jgi:hypothetical protein